MDSLWQGLIDQQIKTPMGITAENLAKQYEITREQCDAFAVESAQRWKAGMSVPRSFNIDSSPSILFWGSVTELSEYTVAIHCIIYTSTTKRSKQSCAKKDICSGIPLLMQGITDSVSFSANDAGYLKEEMAPVTIKTKKGRY